METDDGRDRPSLQSRKRKSGRRSSILKSPTRAALGDLDLNTAQENVEVKAKSRRSSRKVSFANTYQVKEFVLESNWNWPDPAPVQEPEQKPEIEQTGNSRVPSVSGLESLLHAPLQNDSVFTEHEPSVQELPMPNVSDENVQFEHSSVDQGGQSVKPLDTRAFLRRFSSNNSGDSSLFIPERQFSQEKPDASGVYNVYDTGDFNTVMNTSVNKYIGTHISATHERAETTVQGDLQRSSVQNQNATRIFQGSEEDADLDFTECMTNKSGVLNENPTQCYTENMSMCTRTGNFTSMTLIGDNDTTRVYTTGQENQGLKMTRGPLRDRGDIATTVTPVRAHIDGDHVTDQTVNFKLLDNADADMEMTGCYSATISVSGNATNQQPCETTGQQPITAPGCTSTSADLSRSTPIIDAKSFLARFLGNQNHKQSQEFDDRTGNASSYSPHTAHSETAGSAQTDKTINFKVADMDDSMEMTKCVTQAFPFVATEKEGSVGNTAETFSQDEKQTGSIQTRPGPDTTINFKQIGMNDDIELTTCVTQKMSEWQHAVTPGGERPNAASDKTINFKTLDADDNMELTQHLTQNISTVVPSSLGGGPAKVDFISKLSQSKVTGSDATINFKQLGTGDDLDFTTCVTANISEWNRKELSEKPNTDTDRTVNFKTMGADDDMEFTQNIGTIVPGSSSEDSAKHSMNTNQVQPRMAESETGPDRTINFKQIGGGDDLELTTCATQKMSFLDSQKFSGRDQDNTNTCSDRTINFKTAGVDNDMELTQHVTQNVSSVEPGMLRGSTTKLNVSSNQHETDVMPSQLTDNKTINFKQLDAGDDIDLTACVTQNISLWDAKELQEKVKSCTDRTVNFKDLETGGDMELTQHVTQTIQHVAPGGHAENQSEADQKHGKPIQPETVVDRTINFKQLGVGDDIELTTCVTQNISTWNSKQALPVEGSKVSDDKTINFKSLDVDDNMELTQHGTQTVDSSRSVTEQTTNHTVNFKVLGKHDNMEMTLCEPNNISAYAAGERCLLERRPSNQSSCGKEDLSGDVAGQDDGAVMGQVNAEVTSNQSKVTAGGDSSGQIVRDHIDVPDESAGRAGEGGDMEVTMGYSTQATPGRAREGDDMEITMGYSTETTPGRACMREAMEVTEGYSTQTPVGKSEDMDVDSSKSESNVEKGLEDEAEKGRTEDNAWVKKMKRRLSQIIPLSQVQDVNSGHAQLQSSIKNDAVVTSDDARTASPAAKTAADIAQVNAGPEAGVSLAGENAIDVSLLNVSGLDNLSIPNITMSLLNADPFMMSCKTPSIAVPSKSLTVPGEETTQKQGASDDTEVGAINLTSFPVGADFSIGSLDDIGEHIPPSEDPAHTVNVEIGTVDDHPQESNKTHIADDEDNVMEATDVPLVGDDECGEMLSQTRAEDNRTLAQSVMEVDISRSNSILTSRSMLGDLSDISLLSSSNMGEILHFLGVTGQKPKHSRTSIVAPINVAAPSSFSDYLKLNFITSPQVATYQWVVDWISQRIEQLKSSAKELEASLQEQPPKELANVASLSASEVQDLHHKVLTLRNHGLVHAKTQWKQWRIKVLNRIHGSLQEGVTHLDTMMEEVQTRNVNMENAIRLLSQEEAGLDELLSAESSPSSSEGLLEECKAVSQELNLTRAELSEIQAEKSTLAKERAEGMLQEDRLHNRLQELQHQLKAVQQQPQNLAHLKRCMSVQESACAWRLTHLDETQGIFSFPRACIQLCLNFGTCLDEKWVNSMLHRHIKSLSLQLQSKDDASPYYKLCHSYLQLRFDSLACSEWCTTTHQLPKLLEKLSAAVTHTRHLAEEVWEHFVPPFVQVDGDSLTLTVSNLKCHVCFYLTLTFPSGIYPDQQVSWSVNRYIGKISEENLGESLKRVEPGPFYFTRLVEAVNTYIQSDRS